MTASQTGERRRIIHANTRPQRAIFEHMRQLAMNLLRMMIVAKIISRDNQCPVSVVNKVISGQYDLIFFVLFMVFCL